VRLQQKGEAQPHHDGGVQHTGGSNLEGENRDGH